MPTNKCRICLKPLTTDATLTSFISRPPICYRCFSKLQILCKELKIDGCKTYILYEYEETLMELIYQYKGAYDIALAEVFPGYFLAELRRRYFGYTIVPIPSNVEDDIKRGFNHIVEIAEVIGLPIATIIEKNKYWKQSEMKVKERKNIAQVLEMKKNCHIPKRVLILDDIMTTGSTVKSAIALLRRSGAVKIKVLLIAKKMSKNDG